MRFDYYPGFERGWWPYMFRGLFSFIIMGLLIATLVMLIMAIRKGSLQAPGRYGTRGDLREGPYPQRDPALEEVRMRYARGEITREEYNSITQDLEGRPVSPTQSTGASP
ncbi:MAG: hypothetical protein M3164_04915 [Actinomycetota bacterium]|nr:hypothetical protein [Actinomycetota bacterium]